MTTPTPTPTPIPLPLPVSFGPHEADWWMVVLTAAGIIATIWIALLTYRANMAADASRQVADRVQMELLKSNAENFNASAEATRAHTETLTALVERLEQAEPTEPDPGDPEREYPAPRRAVEWLLMRDLTTRKGRWSIQNTGTATAHGVTIQGVTEQDEQDLYVPHSDPIDVDPSASLPFSIHRSLASPPATLVRIKWIEADGSEYESRVVVS